MSTVARKQAVLRPAATRLTPSDTMVPDTDSTKDQPLEHASGSHAHILAQNMPPGPRRPIAILHPDFSVGGVRHRSAFCKATCARATGCVAVAVRRECSRYKELLEGLETSTLDIQTSLTDLDRNSTHLGRAPRHGGPPERRPLHRQPYADASCGAPGSQDREPSRVPCRGFFPPTSRPANPRQTQGTSSKAPVRISGSHRHAGLD